MRWPYMTKAEHEREVQRITDAAADAIDREFTRAMTEGKAAVHAWARDTYYELFQVSGAQAKAAAIAALQQAERQFGPAPLTLSDVLYAPANVKEAVDAAKTAAG